MNIRWYHEGLAFVLLRDGSLFYFGGDRQEARELLYFIGCLNDCCMRKQIKEEKKNDNQ